jgi:hypothetical protein
MTQHLPGGTRWLRMAGVGADLEAGLPGIAGTISGRVYSRSSRSRARRSCASSAASRPGPCRVPEGREFKEPLLRSDSLARAGQLTRVVGLSRTGQRDRMGGLPDPRREQDQRDGERQHVQRDLGADGAH